MKTIKLATVVAGLLLATGANAAAKIDMGKTVNKDKEQLKIYGFSQLQAVGGEGNVGKSGKAVAYNAQRIRLGLNYTAGKVGSKLFIDFNQSHSANGTSGIPKMIKDAFVKYSINSKVAVKLGMIKMPHGMGFTIPGWNLDIAERGFDKKLVLERNEGLMISARSLFGKGKTSGFEMGHEKPRTGLGFDVMLANQAERSAAVTAASNKDQAGNSVAARLHYDMGEMMHFEASYALSQNAGNVYNADGTAGSTAEDYTSIDVGVDSHMGPLNIKGEYITGNNIKGTKDWNEVVMTATGAYALNTNYEVVTKYISGTSTKGTDATATKLANIYLGLNIHLNPVSDKMNRSGKRKNNAHKVVLNYILASGDTDTWSGRGGYTANAWMAQYQIKY